METAGKKGIAGRISSSGPPPRPGTFGFMVVKLLMAANTAVYRLSKGRVAGSMDGAPVLLLHHTGARSGTARTTPLLYLRDGEDYVIVASYGGAKANPAWFHNLMAAPRTTIEVRGHGVAVHAERADAAERERLWPQLVALWPAYADYQARTEREIPVVRLTPTG